jgi:hypothetical protein
MATPTLPSACPTMYSILVLSESSKARVFGGRKEIAKSEKMQWTLENVIEIFLTVVV